MADTLCPACGTRTPDYELHFKRNHKDLVGVQKKVYQTKSKLVNLPATEPLSVDQVFKNIPGDATVCEKCNGKTTTIEVKHDGLVIRRRKECKPCSNRFSTYEVRL